MNQFKLTNAGKIVVLVLVAVILIGVGYFSGWFDNLSFIGKGKVNLAGAPGSPANADTLQVSLDEWVGWKPIIDANGGLTTKSGSIYDQLGLKVNINIINDATQSSTSLINGSLHAAGYTVNRFAFLYPKFRDNNCPVKMVYITNTSTGGDGIIAKSGINRVEDLVGKKVGVPRFSEAQTLIEWLLAKSSLSDAQVKQIRRNFVMFDTPDAAAKALFSPNGGIDAAATWQPYLSDAQTNGCHVLFSTKAATNIVIDGVVFRQDFLSAHSDKVSKFIEGALKASSLYKTQFSDIRNTLPMMATCDDKTILDMTSDATLSTYGDNISMLDGVARTLYKDMCAVWGYLGEKSDESAVNTLFDGTYVKTLEGKFPNAVTSLARVTEEQRNEAKAMSNDNALLTQRLSINFATGSATISQDSYPALDSFAGDASILNGFVVQLEGNTDNVGDAVTNRALSEQRARSVATYLKYKGIDPTRFVIVGNGPDKPIGDNSTSEGRATNRRTDIYFKSVN